MLYYHYGVIYSDPFELKAKHKHPLAWSGKHPHHLILPHPPLKSLVSFSSEQPQRTAVSSSTILFEGVLDILLPIAVGVNQCPISPTHSYTYDSEILIIFSKGTSYQVLFTKSPLMGKPEHSGRQFHSDLCVACRC